ncbi:MAG TPA: urea carboxylase-associated family protein, partial [Steroidobacteraceae bacterium]|nr:urea carboxylase-associated family protein [Steroidobacteraceae bacterium]
VHQHGKDVPILKGYDEVVTAGEPWMGVVRRGQSLRIVDLEGNQAVDTLFYNAGDTAEHYSAQNTIQAQQRIYLTTGTVLLSNRGNPMLRIEEDTCGHDLVETLQGEYILSVLR